MCHPPIRSRNARSSRKPGKVFRLDRAQRRGQTLRRFLDTNGDNKVDLWAYYQDGVEIYRDLDADFDGKADQYRWLATAGTRWGLDPDEDGRINSWKVISPEELTAEVVAALRDKDARRFQILLPTREEIESLGLGEKQRDELAKRVEAARGWVRRGRSKPEDRGAKSQWLQFGATRPASYPPERTGPPRTS